MYIYTVRKRERDDNIQRDITIEFSYLIETHSLFIILSSKTISLLIISIVIL